MIWRVLLVLGFGLLVSCGGSFDVAIPGAGGTGTRDGIVTGFGSVYIDGERFDNSQVQATQATGADQSTPADFALGQRVSIEYDTASSVIKTARLTPHLVGPVESVNVATGWLQVLGQAVRVATLQTPYAERPGFVTQLASSASNPAMGLTDIQPGQWVEVHGHWLGNMPLPGGTTGYGLLASRVQWLAAPRDQALLTGQVESVLAGRGRVLTYDGRALDFNDPTRALAAGQTAKVWLDSRQLAQWQPSQSVKAVEGTAQAGPKSSGTQGMVIMGPATAWNAQTRQLQVNGQSFVVPERLLTASLREALAAQPLQAHCQIELVRSSGEASWTVEKISLAQARPR